MQESKKPPLRAGSKSMNPQDIVMKETEEMIEEEDVIETKTQEHLTKDKKLKNVLNVVEQDILLVIVELLLLVVVVVEEVLLGDSKLQLFQLSEFLLLMMTLENPESL